MTGYHLRRWRPRVLLAAMGLAAAGWLAVTMQAPAVAWAQSAPVGVGLTVEPQSVTVGDAFTLTLSASHPPDYHIAFPQVAATWGEFEVRSQTPLPTTVHDNGTVTSSVAIEVVLFSPGTHATPALSVAVRRPDGSVVNRPVRPVEITVESVLNANDSELRDIKPQADVPVPPLWPVAASGAAGLVLLAILGSIYWRRKMTPGSILATHALLDPVGVALEELDRIEGLDLPSERRFKEHYTLVSDCLRVYLRGQLGVPAPDMTTPQIVETLDRTPLSPSDVRDMSGILEEADLVKFARLLPDLDEARDAVLESRKVVREIAADGGRPASRQAAGLSGHRHATHGRVE